MYCPNCGAPNLDTATKCVSCQLALPKLTEASSAPNPTASEMPPAVTQWPPNPPVYPDTPYPNPGQPAYDYSSYNPNPQYGTAGVSNYSNVPPSYAVPADRAGVAGFYPYPGYRVPADRVGVSRATNTFWSRVGAYLIDQIISGIIFFVVFGIPLIAWITGFIAKYANQLDVCSTSAANYDPNLCNNALHTIFINQGELSSLLPLAISTALLGMVLVLAYQVLLTARGQTLGKRAFGLKVVRVDGSAPGFGTALLRQTIGYFISNLFFGLGFLWVAFDSQHRGWHDYMAGTYVIPV